MKCTAYGSAFGLMLDLKPFKCINTVEGLYKYENSRCHFPLAFDLFISFFRNLIFSIEFLPPNPHISEALPDHLTTPVPFPNFSRKFSFRTENVYLRFVRTLVVLCVHVCMCVCVCWCTTIPVLVIKLAGAWTYSLRHRSNH